MEPGTGRHHVCLVARHVRIVYSRDFRLALVAVVFPGGPDVRVGDESGLAVLSYGKYPVMIPVQYTDSLSLSHGELLVASRGVVAYCRHPQVCRAIFSRFGEHLGLERRTVGVRDVARVVVGLVAGGLRTRARVAGTFSAAACPMSHGSNSEVALLAVGRSQRLVWRGRRGAVRAVTGRSQMRRGPVETWN